MAAHPYLILAAISLALGLMAGLVMHRADYCLAGMFRDLFLFRQSFMLRTLVLLVTAAMFFLNAARLAGLPLPSAALFGPPGLSNLLGGFAFGVGMVLAGGCVVGTLYKMGAGSLVSAAAFVGLVAGSTVYAELAPTWSAFARATTFSSRLTLPEWLGLSPIWVSSALLLMSFALLLHWGRSGKMTRSAPAEGYLQPWRAALLLALLVVVSDLTIGMPFGITTAYTKVGGYLEALVAPRHFATLGFYHHASFRYLPPLAAVPLQGGAAPRLDVLAAIQFPLVAGIFLGAAISAIRLREFHVYVKLPPRQFVSAFAGGAIMGLAARLAPSCNVWHLLGGLPLLASSSVLFLGGLLPGSWLGSRLLVRWVLLG